MSKRIVNVLEPIDGNQNDSCKLLAIPCSFNLLRTSIGKKSSVRKIRQPVVISHVLDFSGAVPHHIFQMILIAALLIEQLVVREGPANCGLNVGDIKRLG